MSLTLEQFEAIQNVLFRCGAVRDPYEFCVYALKSVGKVVPFDQGRIFFMDDSAEVFDQYLVGVNKKVADEYHRFYSQADGRLYSVKEKEQVRKLHIRSGVLRNPYKIIVHDWEEEPHTTRFYREYVLRLGIRYSTGFSLCDMLDRTRALFVLDRLPKSGPYSEEEQEVLSVLNHHLDDLFRNFFVTPPVTHGDTVALTKAGVDFTKREMEVAKLLVAGLSPKRIAEKLGISRATVYKHASNVHAKLGVSNQLELVSRLRLISDEQRRDGREED